MDKWEYDHHSVGERIRRRRLELNMTQDQLAEAMEKSVKYCGDVERGTYGMTIETMLKVCCALQLSPSVLLLGDALPFAKEDSDAQQILQGIAECSAEQQRTIIDIIRLFTAMV